MFDNYEYSYVSAATKLMKLWKTVLYGISCSKNAFNRTEMIAQLNIFKNKLLLYTVRCNPSTFVKSFYKAPNDIRDQMS